MFVRIHAFVDTGSLNALRHFLCSIASSSTPELRALAISSSRVIHAAAEGVSPHPQIENFEPKRILSQTFISSNELQTAYGRWGCLSQTPPTSPKDIRVSLKVSALSPSSHGKDLQPAMVLVSRVEKIFLERSKIWDSEKIPVS